MAVTWAMIRERAPSARPATAAGPGDRLLDAVRRPGVPLLIVALVLLMAANSASVSALPLLVTQQLGLDVIWSGIALGVAAALEIPVLIVLGQVASRYGQRRLVAGGCLAGIAYFAAMTVCTGPVRARRRPAPQRRVRRDRLGHRADSRAGRRRPPGPGVRAVHEHHPRRRHHRGARCWPSAACVDPATAGSSPSAPPWWSSGWACSSSNARARGAVPFPGGPSRRALGDAAQPLDVGGPPLLVDVGEVGQAVPEPATAVELLAQDVEVPGVPGGLDRHVHEQVVQVGVGRAPPRHVRGRVEGERLDRLVGERRDAAVEVEHLLGRLVLGRPHVVVGPGVVGPERHLLRPRPPEADAEVLRLHPREVLDDAQEVGARGGQRHPLVTLGEPLDLPEHRLALGPEVLPRRRLRIHAAEHVSPAGTLDSSTGGATTGPSRHSCGAVREVEHREHVARPDVVRRRREVGERPPPDVGHRQLLLLGVAPWCRPRTPARARRRTPRSGRRPCRCSRARRGG